MKKEYNPIFQAAILTAIMVCLLGVVGILVLLIADIPEPVKFETTVELLPPVLIESRIISSTCSWDKGKVVQCSVCNLAGKVKYSPESFGVVYFGYDPNKTYDCPTCTDAFKDRK